MYKILDYHNPKWTDLVKIYNLDIYFSPGYCKIWEDYGDGKAQAFLYESNLGKVLYPYLVREIDFKVDSNDIYDITTPYGYGGPVLLDFEESDIPLLVKEFRSDFNAYAHEKGIVSEFIRFHPIYKNYNYFINSDIECNFIKNTIAINLGINPEDIFMAIHPHARQNISRAIKHGLDVRLIDKITPGILEEFYKIYLETMERVDADDYFKFSLEMMQNIFKCLKDNAKIISVYCCDKTIASSISFSNNEMAHYHLSASLDQYRNCRPNDLLVYKTALIYEKLGKKYLHIGGGFSGNDSLFRFKRKFNKKGILDFFVGTKIFDEKVFKQLVNKWKERNHLGKDFQSDFFPLYRLSIDNKRK